MDIRLKNIRRQLCREPTEQELRLQELEEELCIQETRVMEIIRELPDEKRTILEGYLCSSAELELHTVVQAFQQGKKLGEEIGRNYHMPLYRP